VLALQRRVGNDAVRTLAEGQVVLQRQGGEPAPTPAPTPNPAVQALAEQAWENDVREPIREAHRDLAGPREDFAGAYAAVRRAKNSIAAAMSPLRGDDFALRTGGYVIDDLARVEAYLAAKLGVRHREEVAADLVGVYAEAELFGQQIGVVAQLTGLLPATSGEGGS
jgi:hypothetical protein